MAEVQITFSAAGVSAVLPVNPGESADYAITGTFVGTVDIEQSGSPTTHFETLASAANAGYSGTLDNTTGDRRWFRFRARSWTSGTALSELWNAHLDGVQEILNEDRIGVVRGAAILLKGSAASLLLSAPRSGLDDGKELTIIDGTGYAHTVTTPANGINGAWDVITFGATVGDAVRLRARNGVWYATDLSDVQLSNA